MASRTETEQIIDTNLPDNAVPRVRTSKHRQVEKKIVEYATNCIQVTGSSGLTITDSRLTGRDVGLIVIDDMTKNIGFTKTTSGSTITFTDGTELIGGETITITML